MPTSIDQDLQLPPVEDESPAGDPFIRVGSVFRLLRAHFPGPPNHYVEVGSEPRWPDSCRLLDDDEIQQYRFQGAARWVSYREVLEGFDRRREATEATSNSTPYPKDYVFAPYKLVLRDRMLPIRAILTQQPVYPERGKIGVLREKQPVFMAFAALAALNSGIGQAFFRASLIQRTGSPVPKHHLSPRDLSRVPVAHRDCPVVQLRRIADRAHQVVMLHAAGRALHRTYWSQLRSLREDLNGAICDALGLGERAHELLQTVEDLDLVDVPTMRHFVYDHAMPRRPSPVALLSAEQEEARRKLIGKSADASLTADEQRELARLQASHDWQDRINAAPAWSGTTVAPTSIGQLYVDIGSIGEHSESVHRPPAIVRDAEVCAGEPRIAGTRVTVHDVVSYYNLYGRRLERVQSQALPELSMEQLKKALDYYRRNKDEIDSILRGRAMEFERLRSADKVA